MKSLIIASLLFISSSFARDIDLKQLKCLVCRTVVDEFLNEVNNVNPLKEIEVGQYRLDSKGNTLHKKVPVIKSEIYLSEMLEDVCKKMDDYVRATYKSSGKLTLMKLVSDGQLNPLMSQVDIVQDDDMNKSLKYYCTEIVNEHDEDIVESVLNEKKNTKGQICTNISEYCASFDDDLDESEEAEDSENEEYNTDTKTEL